MTIFISLALSIITIALTRYLLIIRKFDAIISSILSSILMIIFIKLIEYFFGLNMNQYLIYIYGASFIGMSTIKILTYQWIYSCAFIFVFFLNQLSLYIEGVGGILGFSAFVSVITIKVIQLTYRKLI